LLFLAEVDDDASGREKEQMQGGPSTHALGEGEAGEAAGPPPPFSATGAPPPGSSPLQKATTGGGSHYCDQATSSSSYSLPAAGASGRPVCN
jgi:hypothetical protein